MSASWGWSPTFKQCFKGHSAMAVTSTHSCHGPILASPSSEPSRARDGGEDTNTLQSWTPHQHPCLTPGQALWHRLRRVPSAVLCRGALVPKQPDTYVNLAEDDINDAANHYEEVEDIPGVPEVALPGKSQRRGVNIQGSS